MPRHHKGAVNAYLDEYWAVSGMKGDGSKRMRGELLNYVSEHGQVGLKVWNGGNVLGLRKGDGDVEEQRISLVMTVRVLEPGNLFGPHMISPPGR